MFILQIILLISSIMCFLQSDYQFLFLLPFALFVFSLVDYYHFKNLKKSFVYYIFYVQAIVRYTVVPLSISLGNQIKIGSNLRNDDVAIFIMIIELLYVGLVFIYQNRKFKFISKSTKIKYVSDNPYLYLMVGLMLAIIISSGFLQKINMIWNLDSYVQQVIVEGEEIESGKLGGVLFYSLRAILLLLISSSILKSKLKSNKKLLLIVTAFALSSLFIIGVSRLSVITFILPFYYLVVSISEKRIMRKMNVALIIIMVPFVVITSLSKFTRGENVADISSLSSSSSLNAYFSGIGNLAIGVDSYDKQTNVNHIYFFANDVIKNIPLLSKLTNNQYTTSKYFNYEIYGHSYWGDQITPLSISGLYHFGVFGIGLYVLLFISMAFYFEKRALTEQYLPYKYILFSLMLTFSMVFMINFSSFFASLSRTFFFVFLPFYVSNKLYKLTKLR